jgi:hypothetical protein
MRSLLKSKLVLAGATGMFLTSALLVTACGSGSSSASAGGSPSGEGAAGGTGGSAGAASGGSAAGGSAAGGSAVGGTGGSSTMTGGGGAGGECGPEIVGEGAPLAAIGACGKLVYRTYPNQGEAESVHRLPDFSFAGYEGGGVAIPDVPVVATVDPADGDDRANIQAAIDSVSSMPVGADGFRGAVLLHKGKYEVGDTLVIAADGVVLRGEGQSKSGTVITATAAKQYTLIEVHGSGSGFGEVSGSRKAITNKLVPVGSRTIDVQSAAGFAAGDSVVVLKTPNQAWIDALGMAQYGWTPPQYEVENERKVVAVSGDQITVDVPIVDAIEKGYGGGAVFKADVKGRVRHAGVEDLRLDSTYANATDENHGWTAVALVRARDSWVRRVTAVHFGYSAAMIEGDTTHSTVEEVAHLDPISQITGGRRYSFYVGKGTGNLFQRCYSRGSRHSFVTGAHVAGPNVWLDCLAEQTNADDGPHHRWGSGLLFDGTKGGSLKVQNRKDSGTGHGWSGAQTLFWNAEADSLVCDAPIGAMNWAIGCKGVKSQGDWAPEEPFGWWESNGTHVEPRSLYLQQLQDRLGLSAVEAITVLPQRTGPIWGALSAWAGQARLSNYL